MHTRGGHGVPSCMRKICQAGSCVSGPLAPVAQGKHTKKRLHVDRSFKEPTCSHCDAQTYEHEPRHTSAESDKGGRPHKSNCATKTELGCWDSRQSARAHTYQPRGERLCDDRVLLQHPRVPAEEAPAAYANRDGGVWVSQFSVQGARSPCVRVCVCVGKR